MRKYWSYNIMYKIIEKRHLKAVKMLVNCPNYIIDYHKINYCYYCKVKFIRNYILNYI